MSKFFEGKETAPEGVIPGVGAVGPGVRVEARDDAHAEAIKATGFYRAAAAPKDAPSPTVADPDPTLTPAAPEKASKKDGK